MLQTVAIHEKRISVDFVQIFMYGFAVEKQLGELIKLIGHWYEVVASYKALVETQGTCKEVLCQTKSALLPLPEVDS